MHHDIVPTPNEERLPNVRSNDQPADHFLNVESRKFVDLDARDNLIPIVMD